MDRFSSPRNRRRKVGFCGYNVVLKALRTRSMRRGIWLKALSKLERAQVDLTLRVVRKVRSPFLALVLDSIVEKLRFALMSRVSGIVDSVGFPAVRRLSEIAKSWGNLSAAMWASDRGFARFLAVMTLNMPSPLVDFKCGDRGF